MRIAALYDIHGNLPALEAVLEDVRAAGAERIVVGGDILPGPMPSEAMDLLSGLDIPCDFIYGNCEVAVLDALAGREMPRISPLFHPAIHWSAAQLAGDQVAAIKSWPLTLRHEIDGHKILFCHAAPQDENTIFTAITDEERLKSRFDGLGVDIVVCGHTHMQFDRRVGLVRVINAGSVGSPYGCPGAYWLLLLPEPELRFTPYDVDDAAARIRETGHPDASTIADSVRTPPSEKEMMQRFETMADA
jgi:putative phosphoesterase